MTSGWLQQPYMLSRELITPFKWAGLIRNTVDHKKIPILRALIICGKNQIFWGKW